MPEFLTRERIVLHLDRIISQAEKELILISPYIKADKDTKDILKNQKRYQNPCGLRENKAKASRNVLFQRY